MTPMPTTLPFVIDHTKQLQTDLKKAKTLLYLGDNCGEICLDKLLIENIKHQNPDLSIYFGVRGAPVVNDSTEEDAYKVGMNELATIVSNGDISQGTVVEHTSPEFQEIYHKADLVIAKGQANYETLSDRFDQNIYFMLITKCKVIANDIGVPERSLVCLNHHHGHDCLLRQGLHLFRHPRGAVSRQYHSAGHHRVCRHLGLPTLWLSAHRAGKRGV